MRVWPYCQGGAFNDGLECMRPLVFASVRLSFGFIVVAGICGCASMSHQVTQQQGHGKKQAFAAPFEQTWRAAIDAVYANHLTVLNTNLSRDGGFISAQRGLNFTSVGENVGIWVTPASPTETSVEIVSRQKVPGG